MGADAPPPASTQLRQRLCVPGGGAPLCKLFMRGVAHDEGCTRTHAAPEARPPCAQHARAGRCDRGAACWFAHPAGPPAAPPGCALVLLAPRCRLERVAAAAAHALRASVDARAAVRGDDARGADYALFVAAPAGGDVAAAASALAADADLSGALTRALWVDRRDDGVADAAAGAAAAARALAGESEAAEAPRVQLRVWPPWAAAQMRDALRAAGLRSGDAGAAAPPLVVDAVRANGRWHWHVFAAASAPGLLSLRGRAAYAPPRAPGAATSPAAVPSRALFKLDEALRRGVLPLRPGAYCADVGAAPGGWTKRLSDELAALEAAAGAPDAAACAACAGDNSPCAAHGHVWAIDPGALTLSPLPRNVTHLRLRGEAAAAPLGAALRGRLLDVVACDANTHPPSAAALALQLAPLMAPDATVVLSLKRFAAGRDAHEADVSAAAALLTAAGFAQTSAMHLFANGAHERTAVWRRSGTAAAAAAAQDAHVAE